MIKLKVKEIRNSKGLTQYQLAKEIDITPEHFRRIENGKVKALSLEILEKICTILDCTPGDLIQIEKLTA